MQRATFMGASDSDRIHAKLRFSRLKPLTAHCFGFLVSISKKICYVTPRFFPTNALNTNL